MRVDSCMNKYNPRNEIEAHYMKRAKKLDTTFAAIHF